MRNIMAFVCCFIIAEASLTAQTKTDTLAVATKDVETVDAIIAALYNVISGPAGEVRNWNRMRSLFLPEGKLVATAVRPTGEVVKRVLTVEEYIAGNGPILEKNGFFEKEILRKQEVYGHIAHCFSTYEARRTATDAEPFMRGINSIQLYNDGKRWWILTVFWQTENKDLLIPKEYLKQ
ncbi:hypothetical protein IQ13_2093 [Lacibacter cauensis]|uniref:Nuclear transport factor 2 family protein n=1 Tax=Lacibacter cauensis TaxID=510947 RepID=A0A562SJW7_9BACT|nr:hypothetical protein [Lacibacter cauensis]TWI81080.1 hypothetical protein IQ13_2093 [Lacibacter cauensis]